MPVEKGKSKGLANDGINGMNSKYQVDWPQNYFKYRLLVTTDRVGFIINNIQSLFSKIKIFEADLPRSSDRV